MLTLQRTTLVLGDTSLKGAGSLNRVGRTFRRSGMSSDLTHAANGATDVDAEYLDGTDFDELTDLIRLVDASDIVEMDVKNTKFSLSLKKQSAVQEQVVQVVQAPQQVQAQNGGGAPVAVAPPPPPTQPAPQAAAAPTQVDGVQISSPMAGTLYRAPAPGEPVFVKEGDKVQKGQTICIIEAMKLMNEIEAEVSGEVVKIEVENGSQVTPGQTLMIIRQS
eukprot:TRINITY_DN28015_c0_g1_i1.p2 TRINITY_DN28015_c0_g1~~TRINITY_DN28015_c0_g1_i1.p2  ORF type:complete len:220 (+),score=52.08 TRINITY_DN28015_c0_g1_i1:114-773(+)